ncbi:helix-turn-helix domain-containing protein [Kitasatospora sp. NBC_00240]|uniref:helix-turn-helix domain-containing protein n=1 Tax=Kitasatospora sp. NBC_00240 TaxID=2903567 RepID=UPI0022503D1B|nr:helix-turn-helix transcriptional regulator [Kitasatospora sp. NBC_00240]MCX5211092.1 helix-turn-helix domain-containing protein [Kitasatospora sp. NBC_00240]
MPLRNTPTARQERLGAELRKLRERAGLTTREAGQLLGVDQAKASHFEAGRASVSEARIRRFAAHCGSDDAALIDALVNMATERVRGWWEEYRDVLSRGFLDLAEAEYHAQAVRTVRIADIPGIMQTEAHARAVFGYTVPELPPADLEAKVAYRVQRRVMLDRCPAPSVRAVIHEAALRMRVGGTSTTREQLTFLLAMSERPAVEIRVIPFAANDFAGTSWPMYYLTGPVPQLDTVHLDTPLKGVFLDAEAQLKRYRSLYSKVESSSLGPTETRDFISRVIKDL